MKTTKTNTMKIYTNQYGTKTSIEIEAICDQINNYLNNGSKASYTTKCNSLKMENIRTKFEKLFTDKCEDGFRITSIDVVGYHFGDLLA
jgi:hypothetical protein